MTWRSPSEARRHALAWFRSAYIVACVCPEPFELREDARGLECGRCARPVVARPVANSQHIQQETPAHE